MNKPYSFLFLIKKIVPNNPSIAGVIGHFIHVECVGKSHSRTSSVPAICVLFFTTLGELF